MDGGIKITITSVAPKYGGGKYYHLTANGKVNSATQTDYTFKWWWKLPQLKLEPPVPESTRTSSTLDAWEQFRLGDWPQPAKV